MSGYTPFPSNDYELGPDSLRVRLYEFEWKQVGSDGDRKAFHCRGPSSGGQVEFMVEVTERAWDSARDIERVIVDVVADKLLDHFSSAEQLAEDSEEEPVYALPSGFTINVTANHVSARE